MESRNDKIIVEVDFSQKREAVIGGTNMLLAKQFSNNRRESNPVVCKVVSSKSNVLRGTLLLAHHGRFTENSPHHLGDNQYSLALNRSVFGRINEDGIVRQMCGNIIVERVYDYGNELMPEHLRKQNKHKFKVLQNGYGYKKGQYIFCYEFSDYEIVYVFRGKETRVIKVYKDDIVGKLVP